MPSEETILARVAHFLAKAADPAATPAEAELALQQANKLMVKHAIDEAMLRSRQSESERRKPVVDKWEGYIDSNTTFSYELRSMLRHIAQTNRVKVVCDWGYATLVGFSEDVSWVKELFMATQLSLLTQMSPKWNADLTVDHNIYNFKRAGYKWQMIWHVMSGHVESMPCERPPHDGGWMIRAYKRHMKLVGDTQPIKTQRHEAFRESFVAGFVEQLITRLRRMAYEATEQASAHGAEVALRDSAEDVNAAFYDLFPDMRPMTDEERAAQMEAWRKQEEAERLAEQQRWDSLTDAQKRKELEEQERRRRQSAREDARWHKQRAARYSSEGMSAGASAANNVNLSRSSRVAGNSMKELS